MKLCYIHVHVIIAPLQHALSIISHCLSAQIPKADFKILLRYIEGLQGNQRQVMAAKARGIVDSHCQSQDIENLTSHKRVHKRALEILKILS